MGYTNTTAHYNLPQYVSTDVPSILGDVNDAYATIDGAIYAAAEDATDAKTDAASAVSAVSAAQADATQALADALAAQTDATTALTNAATAQSTANGAVSAAGTAQSTADGAVTRISAIENGTNAAKVVATATPDTTKKFGELLTELHTALSGLSYDEFCRCRITVDNKRIYIPTDVSSNEFVFTSPTGSTTTYGCGLIRITSSSSIYASYGGNYSSAPTLSDFSNNTADQTFRLVII